MGVIFPHLGPSFQVFNVYNILNEVVNMRQVEPCIYIFIKKRTMHLLWQLHTSIVKRIGGIAIRHIQSEWKVDQSFFSYRRFKRLCETSLPVRLVSRLTGWIWEIDLYIGPKSGPTSRGLLEKFNSYFNLYSSQFILLAFVYLHSNKIDSTYCHLLIPLLFIFDFLKHYKLI